MRRKVWLGSAVALLLIAGICLLAPRLAGVAVILLALWAVAVVAFRLL